METNTSNNSNYKILIIEDDHDIRELIRLQLKLQKYSVESCSNGEEALSLIQSEQFNLFLIDRMLPDTTGLELCGKIRANTQTQKTPIILVTALAETENIIEGLDAVADDYITTPFDINILHARVRAQLRKHQPIQKSTVLSFKGLSVDIKKCRVKVDGEEVSLTNTEFQILSVLANDPGIVHTRRSMINTILGDDIHVTNRTIDTHIAGLRKKLKDYSNLIETIRGVGYRLTDNE